MKVLIIGAGRLGSTFLRQFEVSQRLLGMEVSGFTSTSQEGLSALSGFCRARGYLFHNAREDESAAFRRFVTQSAEPLAIFITVSDNSLAAAVQVVASYRSNWQGSVALHCSGALDTDVLTPFTEKDAQTGILHPCYPIFERGASLPQDGTILYTYTGDEELRRRCEKWVTAWKGIFRDISGTDRTAYHAGAVLSAGHVVSLLDASREALEGAGLSSEASLQVIRSIAGGVIRNVSRREGKNPLASTLTGPFVRGDEKVIEKHREALLSISPKLLELYDALGQRSRKLADAD